ncbi:MAG: response regulator receiver sensor signal transduction histidine kinase [Frankiales bacterium]|nr:response regulator receiver sensor signal transduction histidine kinase [Frankiales bacterium]
MTLLEERPAQAVTTVRVVLVDDTPSLRMLTRLALEDTGFEVVGEAGDGLAGVNLVKQLEPDLVLLDLAMPVMDGLEALPLMRKVVPSVRVVIISGFDRKAMEEQVLEAGADGYVQKGTPPDVLLANLRRLFPEAKDVVIAAPRSEAPAQVVPVDAELAQRLADLEDDMEQLLYVVGHDLSEPVHVIKGFAERLARRARSDDEGEFCEFIVDAADRMQELLDDLLDYARSGRSEMPRELLDCRRVVDYVISGLGTAIADRGARVVVGDLPRDLVTSRLVLTQVMHNLIANGLKFVDVATTPQIRVEGRVSGGTVLLQVSDNGIGIDPGQEERIFEPFTRLHSRDAFGGSGIGLAICRRLVERLGGRIWVESREPGSTFFVELPV